MTYLLVTKWLWYFQRTLSRFHGRIKIVSDWLTMPYITIEGWRHVWNGVRLKKARLADIWSWDKKTVRVINKQNKTDCRYSSNTCISFFWRPNTNASFLKTILNSAYIEDKPHLKPNLMSKARRDHI